ncbi:ABC transporter substrate-binding protein [Pseudanabaena sp. FACHB-2040]|uniref:ABC transporter substrate-binding protein n=1 Tax=Pseudanabaena sp. FACHB-2040 TaxID=2692859 RepID=UPI001683748C|nr:ABC transporter substrate-binding protein [Pseudanabaena sp. FACHB-2040]MBD2256564.1 ABC transporter substrate-binding protein [Pseudanabaena sp. FACHB-2040]
MAGSSHKSILQTSTLRLCQLGFTAFVTATLVACGGGQSTTGGETAAGEATSTEAASGEAIEIGALMPLTGDLQAYGESAMNGINLAIEEINAAGGVLGRPIKLAIGDTQTAPQPSIDAAQKLVSISGVQAVVGPMSSGEAIPVAESVTSKNNVLQISNSATSPVLTDVNDNDFSFRTVPSDAFQGVALAEVVQQKGMENLAIIYINNDYGQGLAESFQEAFEAAGGEISGSVPYEQGQSSYRGELQQLARGGAEALVLIGYPENGITILKQSLEENFFDRFVFTDGMKAPEVISAIGADFLNGSVGTAPQALTESDAYQSFVKSYEAQYGEIPPKPYIDTAYDAVMLIALAMEKAGTTDGTAVRDALREVANAPGTEVRPGEWAKAVEAIKNGETVDYVGASGSLDFDDNGDVPGTFAEWAIENGEIVTVRVFDPANK